MAVRSIFGEHGHCLRLYLDLAIGVAMVRTRDGYVQALVLVVSQLVRSAKQPSTQMASHSGRRGVRQGSS